ncbi:MULTISPECIES: Ku protein [unclassified Streptomyces]|uniref:Ku protein n=1 Tax=unclassified Streptomyces TaxID=2593676 RepID=UPI001EF911D6|nr:MULTISPECIES: Ku protein [unclassified Streptomyces]
MQPFPAKFTDRPRQVAYELLRQALGRSSKVAVAKFAMRDRERLGLLRVLDKVIVLHGLRWPDEIGSASQVDVPDAAVSEAEVDAAVALAETLTGVDVSELRDEYQAALEKVIATKAAGSRPEVVEAPQPASAQVVDLMAMLERSVSEVKAVGAGGSGATVHDLPAKKPAAKSKGPVKKASARKPRSA